jgi:hypothetical protein
MIEEDDLEAIPPDPRTPEELALDAPELAAAAAEPRPERPAPVVEDDPNAPKQLNTIEENIEGLCQILDGATRELAIFTRSLDQRVYDDERVLERVRKLAMSSPFAKLRFLVMDTTYAVNKGSQLLNLGRSLSSYCEFRKVHVEHANLACEYAIVDEIAMLYRPQSDRSEGLLYPHDGMEARLKLRDFQKIWDKSETDENLRDMRL